MFHKRQWQCWVKGFWELHFTSLGTSPMSPKYLLGHESCWITLIWAGWGGTSAVQQPWLLQNEHRGICYWLCPVPKEWETLVDVLSKCFTNIFWGWAHPMGRAQYWWCQITFPVSWLCGSSGWSCGKENIAKNPIMRLQIEREKMENLGRNLQLIVEKKKQFCENTAAVKRLLRSWKMILQI